MGIAKHIVEHLILKQPKTLLACGTPVGIAPSGTMGANGAVTLGTALLVILSEGIWWYFPAGAVYAASPAGFYWTVMSSTTAGTVYANMYVPGSTSFDPPPSPTAIVDAGPGVYTGSTSEITAFSVPTPAFSTHGVMELDSVLYVNNTAGAKTLRGKIGVAQLFAATNPSITSLNWSTRIRRYGTKVLHHNNAVDGTTTNTPTMAAANISTANTFELTMQLATATDYCFAQCFLQAEVP